MMIDPDVFQVVYAAAQETWPEILVAREAFEARWAESLGQRRARRATGRAPKARGQATIAVNDLYLAVALERGDAVAWERFYRDNFDFVRNVAANFAATAEDAQEVAQQFCSEISERIRNYKGWCSLRGWLCAVIPNIVRDYYRRRSKETSLEAMEEEAEAYGEPAAVTSDGGKGAETVRERLDRARCAELLRALLREAIGVLKPQWRDLVFYRYIKGLKSREIGQVIFHVNEDVISKWLKKALARLHKRILHLATTRFHSNRSEIEYCVGLLGGEGFGGF